jgi:hypothetical protein
MARLALAALLLLSARALADEGCAADGTCQADEDENAALLQRSATHKAQVTQHSHANTTETKTLTCYPNYAGAYCGASMKCYQDTTGCSTSGGGTCCKAAGNGAGLEQCKFCGDATCGPCPGGPSPTPTPPPPSPHGGLGANCGNCGSTGVFNGYCQYGLVCSNAVTMMVGSCPTCQYPPYYPSSGELGAKCGNCPSTGVTNGQCNSNAGLRCINVPAGAPPGACPMCQGGFM